MTIRPNPDKVAQLHNITLDHGSHLDFKDGHCAMEVVSWLADQGHTDAPSCASKVIGDYVITLNDRWGDEQRQSIKPFLVAMIGTGSDGKNMVRRDILQRSVAELTSPWLRLAGLHEHAEALDNATTAEGVTLVMNQAYDAIRTAGDDARRTLAQKIEKGLEKSVFAGAPSSALIYAVSQSAADAVTAARSVSGVVSSSAVASVGAVIGNTSAVLIRNVAVYIEATRGVLTPVADAAASVFEKAAQEAVELETSVVERLELRRGDAWSAAYLEMGKQIETSEALADLRALRDEQEDAALRILDRLIKAEEYVNFTTLTKETS